MNDEIDNWFVAEILPHEDALTRYLYRVWSNPADVPDLRQEIYMRVYESAAAARPGSPRAFMFATARNLMADHVRRDRIVSIDYTQDIDSLNVLLDELSPEARLSSRQELRRLSDALDRLSDTCRAVIWLRRVEGLSQRETAERLGISEGALEGYLSRGVRALAKAIFTAGSAGEAQGGARTSKHGTQHGQPGD